MEVKFAAGETKKVIFRVNRDIFRPTSALINEVASIKKKIGMYLDVEHFY